MSSAQAKGSRVERELVRLLDKAGFAVMRAPASGGASSRELPDVLAGNGKLFYAFEVKSSASDKIYLSGEEVEALVYFSQNFGAKARIGVRFNNEKWYFFHPGDLYITKGGNYRVSREDMYEKGIDFEELVGESEKTTFGDYNEEK